jgi:hypothetical protein
MPKGAEAAEVTWSKRFAAERTLFAGLAACLPDLLSVVPFGSHHPVRVIRPVSLLRIETLLFPAVLTVLRKGATLAVSHDTAAAYPTCESSGSGYLIFESLQVREMLGFQLSFLSLV